MPATSAEAINVSKPKFPFRPLLDFPIFAAAPYLRENVEQFVEGSVMRPMDIVGHLMQHCAQDEIIGLECAVIPWPSHTHFDLLSAPATSTNVQTLQSARRLMLSNLPRLCVRS